MVMENTLHVPAYSSVLVALLKGPLYAKDAAQWKLLLAHERDIKLYFNQLAVRLYLNELEGYAFLQPLSSTEKEQYKEETGEDLPTLINQRKLTYSMTLLLVLLRKKLLELDAQGDETRLILSQQELVDMTAIFLPEVSDEAKQLRSTERDIKKLIDMGILRKLRNDTTSFEVNRILNAKITPAELETILGKLKEYRQSEEAKN